MVKKRERKRSRAASSDENVTDEEFALDDLDENPPQKKYSLRTRSSTRNLKPLFTFDEGSDDEEEEEPIIKKIADDDEDYEIEDDDEEEEEVVDEEILEKKQPERKSNSKSKPTRVSPLPIEPSRRTIETKEINPKYETDIGPANADGLIDFEDMIRADIVVVKGSESIDYDSIIAQSKVRQRELEDRKKETMSVNAKDEEDEDPLNIFEPEIQTLTELENHDSLFLTNGNDMNTLPLVHVSDKVSLKSPAPEIASNSDDPLKKELKLETSRDPLKTETHEDEDDDVIVLGEMKTPLIVLDD